MLFNSYEFLFLFLPATLLGYYVIGRFSHSGALIWLSGASLVFYASGAQSNLTLILSSICLNYFAALGLARLKTPRSRYLLAAALVLINIGFIAYFKYATLAVTAVNGLLGVDLVLPAIVLPLGISFWTFQKIAYIVDTHKNGSPIRSLPNYVVFVLFFPQLIAGPIVHHEEIVPQLTPAITSRVNWTNLAVGFSIFVIGLGKKMIFADNVALFSTPVFQAAADGLVMTPAEAWTGVLAYTLQIYFDFSGYSDMAIGLGRMFGITLPLNFNSPYKADSIIDFWRRWHMTLSRFLRDYLYKPLGGNRSGPLDRYANLLLTMLIGGLWHGAAWTFVVWGGLHGIYLIINQAFRAARERGWVPSVLSGQTAHFAGRSLTFFAVVVAWVFFRAENWGGAWCMIDAMFSLRGFAFASHVVESPATAWGWIGALFAIAWFAPSTQMIMRKHRPALGWDPEKHDPHFFNPAWQPSPLWALAMSLILTGCILNLSEASEFIYFNF
jgi:D-alanyl-lipoteichoic acid acyltransferase DltB (MBOAT superfamily)